MNRGETRQISGGLHGELATYPSHATQDGQIIGLTLGSVRPEDIFGSVQVDSNGNIEGNFQTSGTYRIVTNEGM